MTPAELNAAATTLTWRSHPTLFMSSLIAYFAVIAGIVVLIGAWTDKDPLASPAIGLLLCLCGVVGSVATRLWHKAHFRRQAQAAGLTEAQAAEIWKTADEDAQD